MSEQHKVGDLVAASGSLGVIVRIQYSLVHGRTLYAIHWSTIGYGFPYEERDIKEWKDYLRKSTR